MDAPVAILKSTLLGRLLHDANGIYEDQFAAMRSASATGTRGIDFSLVTDGLRAERAQGITIEVAYRYFSTARRKFIIADAPGHERYTRSTVAAQCDRAPMSGASPRGFVTDELIESWPISSIPLVPPSIRLWKAATWNWELRLPIACHA